jgi:hypothetical protein
VVREIEYALKKFLKWFYPKVDNKSKLWYNTCIDTETQEL